MENIADKVDGVDDLSGSEYTSHKNDNLNAINASGQVPALGDTYQQAKANTIAAVAGDYFTDTGASSAVNFVHLLPRSGNVTQPTHETGARVRFIPANANTSAEVFFKVGELAQYYLSYTRETSPSAYPPVCTVGILDTEKIYTAVLLDHPDGTHKYWSLLAIESADIGDDAIENRNMADNSVSVSNIVDSSVTNSKLATGLSLDKFGGGTLAFTEGGYTISQSSRRTKHGSDAQPNAAIYRQGIEFGGTGSPGTANLQWRFACYDIKTQLAASSLSDATTRTAGSHEHRIGQQYIFASNIDTGIPISANLLSASISYTEVSTGRRLTGVPVIMTTEEGSTNLEIVAISIQNVKDAGVDYVIDTAEKAIMTIYFSGDLL